VVNEYVSTPILRDKAVALFCVEPLHCSGRQFDDPPSLSMVLITERGGPVAQRLSLVKIPAVSRDPKG
jgi:hypothetical protein